MPVSIIIEKFDIAILGTSFVICGCDRIRNSLNTTRLEIEVNGKKEIKIINASI